MIQTLTIGSIILAANNATGYLLGNTGGFDFPKARVDIRDRGQHHGAKIASYIYGRRLFTLEGQINGSSYADYEAKRRALQQACDLDNGLQWAYITTKGGLLVQTQVIVNSEILEPYQKGQGVIGSFQLSLVADFPYLLAQAAQTVQVKIFTGGGGAVPMTIPFSLGNGGSNTTAITNNGNAKAYPTITLVGPLQTPSIQNVTTGKTLSVNYTLPTISDSIVLDFYNRTAVYNGLTNILSAISGDWWTFAPGINQIELSAGVVNSVGLASIVVSDSYLGI